MAVSAHGDQRFVPAVGGEPAAHLTARIHGQYDSWTLVDEGELIPKDEIPSLLTAWLNGDMAAGGRLFRVLYGELRRLAHLQLRGLRGGTLDTGAVIHETYMKLAAGATAPVRDRTHFLALASRVMRQVVIDYARQKSARKRRADLLRLPPQGNPSPIGTSAEELIAIDEALSRLAVMDPRAARLVELRFFGGLTVEETAAALQISTATVKRDWLRARAFLFQALHPGGSG